MKTIKSLLILCFLLSGFQQVLAQNCQAFFSTSPKWVSVLDSQTQFTNYSSFDSTFDIHYKWTVDGVTVATTKNLQYSFSAIDSYLVCLIRIDSTNNCADTFCRYIPVTYQGNCFTRLSVKDTIDSCHVVLIPKYEDSRAIDSIVVNFGDGDSTTLLSHQRIVHKYDKSAYYRSSITTYAGAGQCRSPHWAYAKISGCKGKMLCNNRVYLYIQPDSASIKDTITYPDARFRLWDARTYLIRKNLDTLTALDSLSCTNCRQPSFTDVCAGSYYIKVALDSTDSFYQQFVPTYHGNVLRWDSVPKTTNIFGIERSRSVRINMIKALNPGGPGFIGGLVTQGANKKEGDPIGGIQIMALNAKNEPVAYTYSRNDGRFFLKNLPEGTFYVYAEIPGVKILGDWITLTKDDNTVNNVKVEVSTGYVTTSLQPYSQVVHNPMNFYPNPTQGTLNISVGDLSGQIILSDLSGRELMRTNIYQSQVLSIEQLESGTYFISFVSESGISFRKTLIRE